MFRFWLRSDYKNTILVKTVCGRAARAARLTAEAQNLERSGPYFGSFSVILSRRGEIDGGEMEARRKRDGGELEASWRRDADGEELGARRRRRWRRDGRCRRETGARWRRDQSSKCEAPLGTSRHSSAHLGVTASHRPARCAMTRLTGGVGRSLERH